MTDGAGGILVRSLDHAVMTVADIDATVAFYERVLGMRAVRFSGGRTALRFGDQKINLHAAGAGHPPVARAPAPGAMDLCFLVATPLSVVVRHLGSQGVDVLEGPVRKEGATGPIRSLYFHDPDGNLIELSVPLRGALDDLAAEPA